VSGEARDSVRQSARPVIELDFGILVYPPETGGEPWRAVFTENRQRKYRQGATEAKLAAKLERFAAPVIGAATCQDIKTGHMQQIVNAAPTAGEGDRVHGMLSALVAAGIKGGYLANPRLAMVHWQAGDRPLPAQRVTVSGSRRCGSARPRSRPAATSASSAGRWPMAVMGSGMS